MIHEQTVGQHCWRVACIFVEIFGLPRAEVLYFCLHHDSGELYSGDIPFRIKREVEGLKDLMNKAEDLGLHHLEISLPKLTNEERIKVKISDLLEMHERGEYEYNLGNAYAEPIIQDTMHDAQKLANEHCFSEQVNAWLTYRGSAQYVR
jgi:5'-deoxynucleotidase YfbR-like HD superfamily hydrolase